MKYSKQTLPVLCCILMSLMTSCWLVKDTNTDVQLVGNTFSQNRTIISGVSIKKRGKKIAYSDKKGMFKLEEKSVAEGDVLLFEKDGYVTVSRIFKKNMKLDIFMKSRDGFISVNSKEAQKLTFTSGITLNIPKNAFLLNAKPYTGKVQIAATYFDAERQIDLISAPSLFIAQERKSQKLIPLQTFGVAEIVATTPNNEKLALRNDTGIEIILPSRERETPNVVNFYSLNTETGYWNLESRLKINDRNELRGVVTTVNSAWNADEPCSETPVCIKLKVIYQNGNPGCGVAASGVSYQGSDGIYTPDQNNEVQFWVCPDSVIELGTCFLVCCGPGVPPTDPCCNGAIYKKVIDLSTITMNPSGCTDIGTWIVQN
ncbi:hypothetical protein [uncultured Kordia sp.]|uniref:hypothetical protein n=1 Tax=uncultured Kordia sp. TaxID=507699 RepID=UPI00260C62F8|nr:hypothetical protein [uncultured Kordia sp.]